VEHFDYCIIGAGIIGLASAFKLSSQYPASKILLIESQPQFGSETSSRNSEVIHAGIYYPENSLKANLCRIGRQQLYDFCQQYSVPYQRIGKIIIASEKDQIPQLEGIQLNARKNDVELTLLSKTECLKQEPQVQAEAGLFSANTGIIDSHSYMLTLLALAEQQGVLYSPNTHFVRADKVPNGFKVHLNTQDGQYQLHCRKLINSAGLTAPIVAQGIEALAPEKIPPYYFCRGHYYSYQGQSPFSHLIYPMPSTDTSGLGIHATLDLAGQVRFGPDTQYIDNIEYQFDQQQQGALKEKFCQAIKRYYPKLDANKLQPSYCGIRPKLSVAGELAQDFIIQTEEQHQVSGLINLFGIESPGLTASLAIADQVVKNLH